GNRKNVGPRSNLNPSCSIVEVRPPTVVSRSTTVTSNPAAASSIALASPPGPAPTITTCFSAMVFRSLQPASVHSEPQRPSNGPQRPSDGPQRPSDGPQRPSIRSLWTSIAD